VVQLTWLVPCRFPHAGSGSGVGRSKACTPAMRLAEGKILQL